MQNSHQVASVEEFLDAFSLDKPGGFMNHEYEAADNALEDTPCHICNELRSKHLTWEVCEVCCVKYKTEDMVCLIKCGHSYCKGCT